MAIKMFRSLARRSRRRATTKTVVPFNHREQNTPIFFPRGEKKKKIVLHSRREDSAVYGAGGAITLQTNSREQKEGYR